jgi:hypothetical protein
VFDSLDRLTAIADKLIVIAARHIRAVPAVVSLNLAENGYGTVDRKSHPHF